MSDGIARLTAIEISTLKHVLDHRTAKEIARIEGVSEDAIVNRINRARAKLGGVSRIAAARIVQQHIDQGASHRLVSQPMGVSELAPHGHVEGAPPLSASVSISEMSPRLFGWPCPTKERPINDDPGINRVAWPIGLAFLTVLALVMLNAVLVSLNNISI